MLQRQILYLIISLLGTNVDQVKTSSSIRLIILQAVSITVTYGLIIQEIKLMDHLIWDVKHKEKLSLEDYNQQ